MNCREVMELMQRDLDGDLNQQESSLMTDHVGQCPECAAMLARLKKLSAELEQLPRVAPKFSIVDSILPELEKLHAAETDGRAKDDMPSRAGNPDPARSVRSSRRLLGRISGVVAAGVVAGFLLISQPDTWLFKGSTGNNEASAPNPESAQGPGERSSLMSTQAESPGDHRKQTVTDQYGEIEGPVAGDAPVVDDKKPSVTSNGSGSADHAPSSEGNGESSPASPEAWEFTGMNVPPAATVDSPDGKWSASVSEDGGSYRVVSIEDGTEAYASAAKNGSVELQEWNAESTLLLFTVTDDEGRIAHWQLDAKTWTESAR
ncbi:anti-sigma factor family protein [Paenibacillaceae bacterium WGS1546]|uniref:anti-sigma factor family protein n=1 Tax=Cohnella sp. WGS1546 TaxID=3366810 RepID=UPI00372CF066